MGDTEAQLPNNNPAVNMASDTVDNGDAVDGINTLAIYDGVEAAGTWTLTVHDWVSGDSGTLRYWTLFIDTGF